MSSVADEGRDVDDELNDGWAGEGGLAVDAICTGCRQTRAKWIHVEDRSTPPNSVKHVCQNCQRTTWWNVRRVIRERDDQ